MADLTIADIFYQLNVVDNFLWVQLHLLVVVVFPSKLCTWAASEYSLDTDARNSFVFYDSFDVCFDKFSFLLMAPASQNTHQHVFSHVVFDFEQFQFL